MENLFHHLPVKPQKENQKNLIACLQKTILTSSVQYLNTMEMGLFGKACCFQIVFSKRYFLICYHLLFFQIIFLEKLI